MAVGLEQFYRRSMIGKLFIAMSEDSFAARARGVSTDRMRSLSYVFAGMLGALSGFAGGQLDIRRFCAGHGAGAVRFHRAGGRWHRQFGRGRWSAGPSWGC